MYTSIYVYIVYYLSVGLSDLVIRSVWINKKYLHNKKALDICFIELQNVVKYKGYAETTWYVHVAPENQ